MHVCARVCLRACAFVRARCRQSSPRGMSDVKTVEDILTGRARGIFKTSRAWNVRVRLMSVE